MLPMSNQTVNLGATETQQLRILAPAGVSATNVSRVALTDLYLLETRVIYDYVCVSDFQSEVRLFRIK